MRIGVAFKLTPALLVCAFLSLLGLVLTYILVDSSTRQAHSKSDADQRRLTATMARLEPHWLWLESTRRGDTNSHVGASEIYRREQPQQQQQHHHQLFPNLWDESSTSGGVRSWNGQSALCSANLTVSHSVENFSSLPEQIRDFLTYGHCRSFALILQPERGECGSVGAPGPNVTLLLAIKSDARNMDRRDVIRRTWGRQESAGERLVRRVFLVGVPSRETAERRSLLNALLQEEAREHGDILQWDFLDTFFNLTLKQVLFLDWLYERCAGARYVFNGDDDVFVNTDNMLEHIESESQAGRGEQHLYEGYVISNVGPIRVPGSKYYVPKQVHAGDSYPPYVGGGGILMAGRTALGIRREATRLPMLPIDDVFLGQCLRALGLKPTRHPAFRTAGLSLPSPARGSARRESPASAFHPCYYRELLLVHRLEPFQTLVMWAAVRDPALRCGRPRDGVGRLWGARVGQ